MLDRAAEVLQCNVSVRAVTSDDKLKQNRIAVVDGHKTLNEREQPGVVRIKLADVRFLATFRHRRRSYGFRKCCR